MALQLVSVAFITRRESLMRIQQLQRQSDVASHLQTLYGALKRLDDPTDWPSLVRSFLDRFLDIEAAEFVESSWPFPLPSEGVVVIEQDPPTALFMLRLADTIACQTLRVDKRVFSGRVGSPDGWERWEEELLLNLSRLLEKFSDARMQAFKDAQLNMLGMAVEQSRDMVIVTRATKESSTGGRPMIYVNESLLHSMGYTRDEVLGRSPSMFQGLDTDRAACRRISASLEAGLAVKETLLNYRKDGSACWIDLHIHPLRNERGDITHFVATQRDITESLNAIATLHQQHEFLSRLTNLLPAAIYVYRRSPCGVYSFDFTTAVFENLFAVESHPASNEEVLAMIHPDDLNGLSQSIVASASTLKTWRRRFRVPDPDQAGYRTLEARALPDP